MSQNFKEIQSELFVSKQLVFVDHFFKNLNSSTLGQNKKEAFTLLLKCEQLGFSFDSKLLNIVSNAQVSEMENFWNWMIETNKNIYGASSYKPMYPNFPKQVIEASELELLVNGFMHYIGDFVGMRIMPEYKEKDRKSLKESVNPLKMSIVTEDDIPTYLANYLKANTSLSEASKEILKVMFNYMIEKDQSIAEQILLKNEIPQKENLAFIGALVLRSTIDFNIYMANQFKTPTDLLRLSAALNDGDTSLAKDTKIKNMSRPMRKAFASKLNALFQSGDKEQFMENMFTYKEQWTRLAFAMHIGEYKNKCPLAFDALQKVRSNEKEESFNYKVEKLITDGKTIEASELLVSRAGVFGRMLNQILTKTNNNEKDKVLSNFEGAASSIATPVLLQIHAKFKYDNQNDKKIILPKGGFGKIYVQSKENDALKLKEKEKKDQEVKLKEKKLLTAMEQAFAKKYGEEALKKLKETEEDKKIVKDEKTVAFLPVSNEVAEKVVSIIEKTLIERFKSAPSLGNVYIEDSLSLQNVPFAQRAASKALKTVPKGSRFKKETDKPIIRFFTWWNENGFDKNGKPLNVGRIDIDLSVGVFDKDYNLIKQCAYYDMRSGDYLSHSGDITSAPNGAAEYIDVNIDGLLKDLPNAAYVGQLISSYTQQKYCDLPECYSGWMERQQKQHGEIFEPSTVKNKVDITCDSTQVLTCLYDISNKEYIWADSPIRSFGSYRYGGNNLASVKSAMSYTIQGLVEMKKPNLYDLFEMHAKARGNIVSEKSKADTIFSLEEGITPYDFEVIAAKFMANEFENNDLKKKSKNTI